MTLPSAQAWIDALGMEPHPEGGFFRETYRAAHTVENEHGHARTASTAIYFLLRAGDVSHLHRIAADEGWHLYAGGPLTIHTLTVNGTYTALHLGLDLAAGQRPQHVVPGGVWFGATVDEGADYALVGCTVAPGFDFADFELADRASMLAAYPQHRALIERLT
ncbi:MAG: cupin domain-containing protein [Bacteroidota bacterium]